MDISIIKEETVEFAIEKGIATITFSHSKGNSLNGDVLRSLCGTISSLGDNPEVKVIILKSAGNKTFCAGASLDELLNIGSFEIGKAFFMDFANLIDAMRKCPKFIISRVQGKVVGAGIGLISACDHVLAVESASLKLSKLALWIGPFVMRPVIERRAGSSVFNSLTINPIQWKSANWAKEKGLYDDIFINTDYLDATIEHLVNNLVQSNPETIHHLKKAMWKGTENWNELMEEGAEISSRLLLSKETRDIIKEIT